MAETPLFESSLVSRSGIFLSFSSFFPFLLSPVLRFTILQCEPENTVTYCLCTKLTGICLRHWQEERTQHPPCQKRLCWTVWVGEACEARCAVRFTIRPGVVTCYSAMPAFSGRDFNSLVERSLYGWAVFSSTYQPALAKSTPYHFANCSYLTPSSCLPLSMCWPHLCVLRIRLRRLYPRIPRIVP